MKPLAPQQFVIGRNTFFDFGPPFHYIDVISVAPDENGTRISRMLITPPGDPCTQPAQIEIGRKSGASTVLRSAVRMS